MITIAIVNLLLELTQIMVFPCAVVSNLFANSVLPVVGNGNTNNQPLVLQLTGRISLKSGVLNAVETFHLKIIKME